MKRIIILVGTGLLALLASGVSGATVTYPFADGFESGSYTANWTSGGGSFTRSVTSAVAASGTYSFTMSGGSGTHRTGVSANFATPQTPATATVSLRSSSTGNADAYFVLGPSSDCAVFIYFPSDGYIYVNRDKTLQYQANTWYTIHMELNWTARTLTYYVNGSLVKSGITFIDSPSSVSTVYLYNYTSGSVAWWDNIDIGGAGIPALSTGSFPCFADLDGDGAQDLLLGDATGSTGTGSGTVTDGWELMSTRYNSLQTAAGITLFRNTGTGSTAAFTLVDTSLDRGGAPTAADLDGDGDADLLIGSADGTIDYYRSDSTAGGPVYTLMDTNYAGIDVGDACLPAAADLDGDGDIDLLAGKSDGRISFYRNDGSATSASWSLVDSQFYNIDVGTNSAPSLVDIDNDTDLDLMVGAGSGRLAYYRNDGTALSPTYVLVDSNYFFIDAGTNLVPAWADLDGDGDYDLYAGEYAGGLKLYANTGTAAAAYFTTSSSSYDFAVSVPAYAAPVLADLDGDGDNDLLIGRSSGALTYYRNDGTAALPVWAAPDTAYGSILAGSYSAPALADVDSDDDLDLFIGKYDGRISFYRNDGSATVPAWHLVDSLYFGIDAGSYSIPALTDIDGDGDLDLFIGNATGTMYHYRNNGTPTAPLFSLTSSSYGSIDVGSNSAPAFTDLDGDGAVDLFIGNSSGTVSAYYNTGSDTAAQFTLVEAGYAEMAAGTRGVPAFGDLDDDGDADLLLGRGDGYLAWYRNVDAGEDLAPDWGVVTTGYASIDAGSYSTPVWADIDGDGDLDLFTGNSSGTIAFYRNDGTAAAAACTLVTAIYDSIQKGTYTRPAFADADGDGDLDLFLGAYDGTISYYRNDGTALAPAWNLLDAVYFNIDVGSYAAPAFADIDADGDLDMFIGNSSGTIYHYLNNGTAGNPYWKLETSAYFSIDVGSNAVPAFLDYEGDGDQDLFIGNYDGTVSLYENDSTAQTAHFVLEADMFSGLDVGYNASPCFADIDADNRMGLFIGNSGGTIAYWEMYRPVGIAAPDPVRPALAPGLSAGNIYDLYGRRVYGTPVRPGVYLLISDESHAVMKKVIIR